MKRIVVFQSKDKYLDWADIGYNETYREVTEEEYKKLQDYDCNLNDYLEFLEEIELRPELRIEGH